MKKLFVSVGSKKRVMVIEAESMHISRIVGNELMFITDEVQREEDFRLINQIKQHLAIADPFWTRHYYGMLEFADLHRRLEVSDVFVVPADRLSTSLCFHQAEMPNYARKMVSFLLEPNGMVQDFACSTQYIDVKIAEAEEVARIYASRISDTEIEAFYQ